MTITITGAASSAVLSGDIEGTLPITSGATLLLGDGTTILTALDEDDVWRLGIVRAGSAGSWVDEADPDGATPGTDTFTVDGYVPWIAVLHDDEVVDGMAPLDDAGAALEQIRAGVQAAHNAAVEARGETVAGPGDHVAPARSCEAGLCGVVRAYRAWSASETAPCTITYEIAEAV